MSATATLIRTLSTPFVRTAGLVQESPDFRRDIAGLRAVAVLLVVLYHAGVGVLSGGYVGVDVFFVISGYLITRQLAGELDRNGRIQFGRFYARRLVRLLPASIVVVLATVAATWHWAEPMFAARTSGDAVAASAYAVNVRFAAQGSQYLQADQPPSPLQHFWSLAVEEQFYLFWPLLLALASLVWLGRRRPSTPTVVAVLSLVGAASLALCVWQTWHSPSWAYFGIQARAWELAAGALVALTVTRLARLPQLLAAVLAWSGLAAIAASAVLYRETTLYPGYAAILPVAGAALLIAGGCATPAGGPQAMLGWKPMQEIGRVSYSWYLWHWPVLIIAPYALGHAPGTVVNVALVTAALVPAAMSLTAVEERIRFHPVFRRRARNGLVLGLALTAGAAGIAAAATRLPTTVEGRGTAADTATVVGHGLTPEVIQELIVTSAFTTAMPGNLVPDLRFAAQDFPRDNDCIAEFDETSWRAATARGCDQFGDPLGPTAVLFGDSHAHQWFDAVDAVARAQHLRLVVLTKVGCPAAEVPILRTGTSVPYSECATWRRNAIARIAELRPALIVMSSRDYVLTSTRTRTAEAIWLDGWASTVGKLRTNGARLVVLADTPDPRELGIPSCIAQNPLSVRKCNLDANQALNASRRAAVAARLTPAGVQVIDSRVWFCTDAVCPAIIGNTLVYRDGSHVSATYIRLLGPLLGAQLAV